MLDVIADFWKPVKKAPQPEPLRPELLQISSTLGFGFVPQAILSGRRLIVSAVNTYQFGEEALTSFVLTQEKDPSVSMILAESDGEYYLAISRRISLNDRTRLFDEQELEAAMNKLDATRLNTREQMNDYKGWIVGSYKREIQGLRGSLFKGDFRKAPLPDAKEGAEFAYTLLVSESNEHAIEIEKYTDGRIEIYATVYRRMSDIGEVTHPAAAEARPDLKLASGTDVAAPASPKLTQAEPVAAEAPKVEEKKAEEKKEEPKAEAVTAKAEEPAAEAKQETQPAPLPSAVAPESAVTHPVNLPVFEKPAAPEAPAAVVEAAPAATSETLNSNPTRNDMSSTAEALKPKLYIQPTSPEGAEKATSFGGDNIECELRVANKLIDEAIRNEMRLTDIVRRIIELPVAYPEAVQIPMNLTDEDYALLAIRYGISAADRNAIKRRILEDLNSFSGKK